MLEHKKIITLLFCTLFFNLFCISSIAYGEDQSASSPSSSGESVLVLSLNDALTQALANNAGLKQSALSLQQSARNQGAGGNQWLPSITAPSGSVSMSSQIAGTGAGMSAGDSSASWSAGAGLGFTYSPTMHTTQDNLDATYKRQLLSYQTAVNSLKTSVASSFYSLLADQQNIDILQNTVNVRKGQWDDVKSLQARGFRTELDVLIAEQAYRSAEQNLSETESALGQAIGDFLILLGLPNTTNLSLKGDIETRQLSLPDLQTIVNTYLAKRIDILSAENNVRISELAVKTNGLAKLPSLSLTDRLSVSGSIVSPNGQNNNPPSISNSLSVGINLPLESWLPGYPSSISEKNNKDALQSSQIALDAAKKEAEQDIIKQIATLEQAARRITAGELSLSISKRTNELSEQQYNAGLLSARDLQDSRDSYLQAQQTQLQNRVAYINAVYALATALNIEVKELYTQYGN
ncbi:MAG: TolC family protein [Spirochaetaceae bacterium]|jgi:multidrug efflux system outer membrane protein|nr:TolC family protein [Spirochaetaceae bacterium]